VHAVAELWSWSHVSLPDPHSTFGVVPPAQYVPLGQSLQTAAEVGVGAATCSVPAAHAPCDWHVVWFADDEYVPLAHASHCRSLVGVPAALTYEPAAQSRHASQCAAFEPLLKVPLGQARHVRFVVPLPFVATS
jgi:hypothetical protein